MNDDILLVERDGYVVTLTLNRPEKRNSLSPDLLIRLHQTLNGLAQNDGVRAVILRGQGDLSFSSGYDIAAIPTGTTPEIEKTRNNQDPLRLATRSIIDFPYPVIAMLNGYAFGAGCELAVSCDLRIAADDIRMGMPPAKLGLVYPLAGLIRFIQTLGFSRTRELFFIGRFYGGPRILEMGLVDYMVPRQELEPFTRQLAEEIAGNAPLSIKGHKRILNLLAGSIRLEEDDRKEAERILMEAVNSEDLKEGQAAFLEKRKPLFKGH